MILHNYLSNSGRDLIYEYINSLPEAEKIDGYTVLQHMEKGEFDKILFKRWEKKVYEVYFQKNKTEKKDANIVRKRAKELGNMLGRKFI